MKYSKEQLNDFEFTRSLEWIETNGLGGYASGTVSGANTRKYHGLLVAAMHPPVGRMVAISKLEETIVVKETRFELSSNQYTGAIYPEGFKYLTGFTRDIFPEFFYEAGGVTIKKTIAAIHGENTTVILYEVLEATRAFVFELIPLYAYRDFHAITASNDKIWQSYSFQKDVFETTNYVDCPPIYVKVPSAKFTEGKCWYYNFEFQEERSRGLDFIEDLYTHGRFTIDLKKGSALGVILSMDNPLNADPFELVNRERARREEIAAEFSSNANLRKLSLAADQFIVSRGELKTMIAGYHWFADWGRDTMISLPGLCLITGRFEDAKNILQAFANSVDQGMLPNRFPDYNEQPEYNTIDATLWYFNAIYQYYEYTHDKAFVRSLIPVLVGIIDWHERGTRYNIHVDPADGLIYGGQDGSQLTWMDAKVDNWVVTPRKGKPVEVNALWYNALCCMDFLTAELGSSLPHYKIAAARVFESFNRLFWNASNGFLFDVVDRIYNDDTVRPNAIYAMSLPFPVLTREHAEKVFSTIEKEFLTPRGLRTLGVSDHNYHPVYSGDQWARDAAYHQGTIWSFLLGAYIDALIRLDKNGRTKAKAILNDFFPHLDEAGIGTVSEIFDGGLPHTPRGCIAQSWGVAEIFRVVVQYNLLEP